MRIPYRTRQPTQFILIASALASLLMGGCRPSQPENDVPPFILQTLQGKGSYELLSLDPLHRTSTSQPADSFYGFHILGRTTVTDPQTRQELNEALCRGAKESSSWFAGCFIPRHGVHVVSGGQTVDLVICFECLTVRAYNGGGQYNEFRISDSPQPTFDEVLTAAGVPLPAAAK